MQNILFNNTLKPRTFLRSSLFRRSWSRWLKLFKRCTKLAIFIETSSQITLESWTTKSYLLILASLLPTIRTAFISIEIATDSQGPCFLPQRGRFRALPWVGATTWNLWATQSCTWWIRIPAWFPGSTQISTTSMVSFSKSVNSSKLRTKGTYLRWILNLRRPKKSECLKRSKIWKTGIL